MDRANLSVGRLSIQAGFFSKVEQLDLEEALVAIPVIVEEGAEARVAVEARQAAPDDLAARVDEGADVAVADDREIQRAQGVGPLFQRGRRSAWRAETRITSLTPTSLKSKPSSPKSQSTAVDMS